MKVGAITQSDQLFSGSLADNIAFFDPDLEMRKVVRAAKSAEVHDDILSMPMQYSSLVGDMGSALSAGQRQRVMLARAFYRQPQILMMDEGTANLDPPLEERIADRVAALPMTRIVVAHRPALIERADRVLIVDGGHVREIVGGRLPSKEEVA
jgi:ATP-binding cassette subfamily B protein RaxB